MKKILSILICLVISFSFVGCSNQENDTINLPENDTSSINGDKSNTSMPEKNEIKAEDIANSLISVETYKKFFEEEFLIEEKWQFYDTDGDKQVYSDGEQGFISIETINNDFNVSYYMDANGFAVGVETPERYLEVNYLYYVGTTDLNMYVFSGISLEHCAKYLLKIFENTPAKITLDEFMSHYNGNKKIESNKISEKTLSIKGVEYIVNIDPVWDLDGNLLNTYYSITASIL